MAKKNFLIQNLLPARTYEGEVRAIDVFNKIKPLSSLFTVKTKSPRVSSVSIQPVNDMQGIVVNLLVYFNPTIDTQKTFNVDAYVQYAGEDFFIKRTEAIVNPSETVNLTMPVEVSSWSGESITFKVVTSIVGEPDIRESSPVTKAYTVPKRYVYPVADAEFTKTADVDAWGRPYFEFSWNDTPDSKYLATPVEVSVYPNMTNCQLGDVYLKDGKHCIKFVVPSYNKFSIKVKLIDNTLTFISHVYSYAFPEALYADVKHISDAEIDLVYRRQEASGYNDQGLLFVFQQKLDVPEHQFIEGEGLVFKRNSTYEIMWNGVSIGTVDYNKKNVIRLSSVYSLDGMMSYEPFRTLDYVSTSYFLKTNLTDLHPVLGASFTLGLRAVDDLDYSGFVTAKAQPSSVESITVPSTAGTSKGNIKFSYDGGYGPDPSLSTVLELRLKAEANTGLLTSPSNTSLIYKFFLFNKKTRRFKKLVLTQSEYDAARAAAPDGAGFVNTYLQNTEFLDFRDSDNSIIVVTISDSSNNYGDASWIRTLSGVTAFYHNPRIPDITSITKTSVTFAPLSAGVLYDASTKWILMRHDSSNTRTLTEYEVEVLPTQYDSNVPITLSGLAPGETFNVVAIPFDTLDKHKALIDLINYDPPGLRMLPINGPRLYNLVWCNVHIPHEVLVAVTSVSITPMTRSSLRINYSADTSSYTPSSLASIVVNLYRKINGVFVKIADNGILENSFIVNNITPPTEETSTFVEFKLEVSKKQTSTLRVSGQAETLADFTFTIDDLPSFSTIQTPSNVRIRETIDDTLGHYVTWDALYDDDYRPHTVDLRVRLKLNDGLWHENIVDTKYYISEVSAEIVSGVENTLYIQAYEFTDVLPASPIKTLKFKPKGVYTIGDFSPLGIADKYSVAPNIKGMYPKIYQSGLYRILETHNYANISNRKVNKLENVTSTTIDFLYGPTNPTPISFKFLARSNTRRPLIRGSKSITYTPATSGEITNLSMGPSFWNIVAGQPTDVILLLDRFRFSGLSLNYSSRPYSESTLSYSGYDVLNSPIFISNPSLMVGADPVFGNADVKFKTYEFSPTSVFTGVAYKIVRNPFYTPKKITTLSHVNFPIDIFSQPLPAFVTYGITEAHSIKSNLERFKLFDKTVSVIVGKNPTDTSDTMIYTAHRSAGPNTTFSISLKTLFPAVSRYYVGAAYFDNNDVIVLTRSSGTGSCVYALFKITIDATGAIVGTQELSPTTITGFDLSLSVDASAYKLQKLNGADKAVLTHLVTSDPISTSLTLLDSSLVPTLEVTGLDNLPTTYNYLPMHLVGTVLYIPINSIQSLTHDISGATEVNLAAVVEFCVLEKYWEETTNRYFIASFADTTLSYKLVKIDSVGVVTTMRALWKTDAPTSAVPFYTYDEYTKTLIYMRNYSSDVSCTVNLGNPFVNTLANYFIPDVFEKLNATGISQLIPSKVLLGSAPNAYKLSFNTFPVDPFILELFSFEFNIYNSKGILVDTVTRHGELGVSQSNFEFQIDLPSDVYTASVRAFMIDPVNESTILYEVPEVKEYTFTLNRVDLADPNEYVFEIISALNNQLFLVVKNASKTFKPYDVYVQGVLDASSLFEKRIGYDSSRSCNVFSNWRSSDDDATLYDPKYGMYLDISDILPSDITEGQHTLTLEFNIDDTTGATKRIVKDFVYTSRAKYFPPTIKLVAMTAGGGGITTTISAKNTTTYLNLATLGDSNFLDDTFRFEIEMLVGSAVYSYTSEEYPTDVSVEPILPLYPDFNITSVPVGTPITLKARIVGDYYEDSDWVTYEFVTSAPALKCSHKIPLTIEKDVANVIVTISDSIVVDKICDENKIPVDTLRLNFQNGSFLDIPFERNASGTLDLGATTSTCITSAYLVNDAGIASNVAVNIDYPVNQISFYSFVDGTETVPTQQDVIDSQAHFEFVEGNNNRITLHLLDVPNLYTNLPVGTYATLYMRITGYDSNDVARIARTSSYVYSSGTFPTQHNVDLSLTSEPGIKYVRAVAYYILSEHSSYTYVRRQKILCDQIIDHPKTSLPTFVPNFNIQSSDALRYNIFFALTPDVPFNDLIHGNISTLQLEISFGNNGEYGILTHRGFDNLTAMITKNSQDWITTLPKNVNIPVYFQLKSTTGYALDSLVYETFIRFEDTPTFTNFRVERISDPNSINCVIKASIEYGDISVVNRLARTTITLNGTPIIVDQSFIGPTVEFTFNPSNVYRGTNTQFEYTTKLNNSDGLSILDGNLIYLPNTKTVDAYIPAYQPYLLSTSDVTVNAFSTTVNFSTGKIHPVQFNYTVSTYDADNKFIYKYDNLYSSINSIDSIALSYSTIRGPINMGGKPYRIEFEFYKLDDSMERSKFSVFIIEPLNILFNCDAMVSKYTSTTVTLKMFDFTPSAGFFINDNSGIRFVKYTNSILQIDFHNVALNSDTVAYRGVWSDEITVPLGSITLDDLHTGAVVFKASLISTNNAFTSIPFNVIGSGHYLEAPEIQLGKTLIDSIEVTPDDVLVTITPPVSGEVNYAIVATIKRDETYRGINTYSINAPIMISGANPIFSLKDLLAIDINSEDLVGCEITVGINALYDSVGTLLESGEWVFTSITVQPDTILSAPVVSVTKNDFEIIKLELSPPVEEILMDYAENGPSDIYYYEVEILDENDNVVTKKYVSATHTSQTNTVSQLQNAQAHNPSGLTI